MAKSHAVAPASAHGILTEEPTHEQLAELHRQIGKGKITKSVMQAFLRGGLILKEMKQEEWIWRERQALKGMVDDVDRIAMARQKGFGVHYRYVPAGLTMSRLLDFCGEAGIKLYRKSLPAGGEELSTEEGVLECEIEKIMTPTNREHHPFLLDFNGQTEWAKAEGGDGLTSVEETLYLLLRGWMELGRTPFMGGLIRCRNSCGSDRSLEVYWGAGNGLCVYYSDRDHRDWICGAISRKFLLGN